MDTVCMPWGGDKVNAKPRQIKKWGVKDVGVRLTRIAAASRYLPQLQGTAKEFFKMLFGVIGKCGQTAVGDEICPIGSSEIKILAKPYKSAITNRFALAAKGAPSEIDCFRSSIDSVLRANVYTLLYNFVAALFVNRG